MNAWFQTHFRDEAQARLTIAKIALAGGALAFALMLIGWLLA